MDFPEGCTFREVFLPKLIIYTLTLLGYILATISKLFSFLDLSYYLHEPEPQFNVNKTHVTVEPPLSAILLKDFLPVTKFSDLKASCAVAGEGQPPESCSVCLDEYEDDEEIRRLLNCKHIFHKSCVDLWMDHDKKTCPVCRERLVPRDLIEVFNQRLQDATYSKYNFDMEDSFVPNF